MRSSLNRLAPMLCAGVLVSCGDGEPDAPTAPVADLARASAIGSAPSSKGHAVRLNAQGPSSLLEASTGGEERAFNRMAVASRPSASRGAHVRATTPAERRAAVDAAWGPGFSPQVSLEIFDKFWTYVDAKFAAFHGIDV